jgi:hypothetical protein
VQISEASEVGKPAGHTEARLVPAPTVGEVPLVGEKGRTCAAVYPADAAALSVKPRLLEMVLVGAEGLPELELPDELMHRLFCDLNVFDQLYPCDAS